MVILVQKNQQHTFGLDPIMEARDWTMAAEVPSTGKQVPSQEIKIYQ